MVINTGQKKTHHLPWALCRGREEKAWVAGHYYSEEIHSGLWKVQKDRMIGVLCRKGDLKS